MADGAGPRFAWKRGQSYDYLLAVERPMFAWEWLRRTERYRLAWAQARTSAPERRMRMARAFNLVELVPPGLTAEVARPIWRVEAEPRVLAATPAQAAGADEDRLDIRRLARLAEIALDEDVECWRIGTAARSVRLDIHQGTLLGGPTLLDYRLSGLARVRPKLAPLADLVRLALSSRASLTPSREARARRWIAELRTADAMAEGATQQDIARVLFGDAVPERDWRADSDSYRYRIQRLVRTVRTRLADPLSRLWFR